jgi:hypothetical protein
MAENFRPISDRERAIAQRLLELPIPGREEALAQLDKALVRQAPGCEEHCGTLEFSVQTSIRIPEGTPSPLPVEGRLLDEDGAPVDVLLFHNDGTLTLLEFVVYSDGIKRAPRAEEISLWSRPASPPRHQSEPHERH